MTIDIEKYRKHTDGIDLPEDQKTELLHTVRSIMESFVDRAFGKDSVHHVIRDRIDKSASETGLMIELKATRKCNKQKSGNDQTSLPEIQRGENP